MPLVHVVASFQVRLKCRSVRHRKYVMVQYVLSVYFILIYCCYGTRVMCYVLHTGTGDLAVGKKKKGH
jgi:hypothetical protein